MQIDPHIDAQSLYRILTSGIPLSSEDVAALAGHEAAWPELKAWIDYLTVSGASPASVPVPAPGSGEPQTLPVPGGRVRQTRPRRRPRSGSRRPGFGGSGHKRGSWWLLGLGVALLVGLIATTVGVAVMKSQGDSGQAHQTQERSAAPASDTAGVDVAGLAPAGDLTSAGGGFFCSSLGETVRCMGQNGRRQLGVEDAHAHVGRVSVDGDVRFLVSGKDFTCASSGRGVTCWGDNRWGQAGGGEASTLPHTVAGLEGMEITSLAAGDIHACVSVADGRVACWGSDYTGQVTGAGVQGEKSHGLAWVNLPEGMAWVRVFSSAFTSCAIDEESRVACWGANTDGRITSGREPVLTPTVVDTGA